MIDRSKQITLLWNSLVLPNYTESFTEIKTNNFQYRENSYMDDYEYFIKPTITCVSKGSKEYLNEHFSLEETEHSMNLQFIFSMVFC